MTDLANALQIYRYTTFIEHCCPRAASLLLRPRPSPVSVMSISPSRCISLRNMKTRQTIPTVCKPSVSHLTLILLVSWSFPVSIKTLFPAPVQLLSTSVAKTLACLQLLPLLLQSSSRLQTSFLTCEDCSVRQSICWWWGAQLLMKSP